MKIRNILLVVLVLIAIVVVGICISVVIFGSQDVDVRIERAGICNPLKPVKDKEVPTDKNTKKELAKYWKKTDKKEGPDRNELVDSMIGDYKLFVDEDTILFNLDIGYVSFNGKYVDISDDFIKYLSDYVKENDVNLKKEEPIISNEPTTDKDCCSCCPDLKPGESCIDACCPCN